MPCSVHRFSYVFVSFSMDFKDKLGLLLFQIEMKKKHKWHCCNRYHIVTIVAKHRLTAVETAASVFFFNENVHSFYDDTNTRKTFLVSHFLLIKCNHLEINYTQFIMDICTWNLFNSNLLLFNRNGVI